MERINIAEKFTRFSPNRCREGDRSGAKSLERVMGIEPSSEAWE
jgi:hypothetical protein